MSELLTRMFFGGFVRMHVLYHAVKEPIFGVEMMEETRAVTATTSGRGTLYPMLHQLKKPGLYVREHGSGGRQDGEILLGHPRGGGRPGTGQDETAGWFRGPARQAAQTVNPCR